MWSNLLNWQLHKYDIKWHKYDTKSVLTQKNREYLSEKERHKCANSGIYIWVLDGNLPKSHNYNFLVHVCACFHCSTFAWGITNACHYKLRPRKGIILLTFYLLFVLLGDKSGRRSLWSNFSSLDF